MVFWIFMIDYVLLQLHVDIFWKKKKPNLFDIKMQNNSRSFPKDVKQKTIYTDDS